MDADNDNASGSGILNICLLHESHPSVYSIKTRKCSLFSHCKCRNSWGSPRTSRCAARNVLGNPGMLETPSLPPPGMSPRDWPSIAREPQKHRGACTPGNFMCDTHRWRQGDSGIPRLPPWWELLLSVFQNKCFSWPICFNFPLGESNILWENLFKNNQKYFRHFKSNMNKSEIDHFFTQC